MKRVSAEPYRECLVAVAAEFKQEVRTALKAYDKLEPKHAAGRRAAYDVLLNILKRQANAHGVPLMDLGLVGFEIPQDRELPLP